MSGQLMTHGDGGGFVRCGICGADAAGPCARCQTPVCGDCCVLTQNTAGQWAICVRCDQHGGRSARAGWILVLAWLTLPLLGLCALLVLLYVLFG